METVEFRWGRDPWHKVLCDRLFKLLFVDTLTSPSFWWTVASVAMFFKWPSGWTVGNCFVAFIYWAARKYFPQVVDAICEAIKRKAGGA